MLNKELLREKIKSSRISMEEVAKAAEMDRSTLYRRLAADECEFTIAEAQAILQCLGLNKREVMAIFFSN